MKVEKDIAESQWAHLVRIYNLAISQSEEEQCAFPQCRLFFLVYKIARSSRNHSIVICCASHVFRHVFQAELSARCDDSP